jgi:hypothetical protein
MHKLGIFFDEEGIKCVLFSLHTTTKQCSREEELNSNGYGAHHA